MKILRMSRYMILGALSMVAIFFSAHVNVLNAAQGSKTSEEQSANAENGKRIFTRHGCYECHGREAQGSIITGPRIGPDPIPFESFTSYLRKPTGEMPPYTAKVLSDKELADIYAFLESRPRPPAAKTIPLLK